MNVINKDKLKTAVDLLESAYSELEDIVYFSNSATCSDIASEIYQQILKLKEYENNL